MKKALIVFLVIGILFLVIGLILVIVGGTFGNWNVNYTDEIFYSENDVEKVELDVAAGNATVEFYDGDKIEITYQAHPKHGFTANQSGGTVKLGHHRGGWFNWTWGHKGPTATVKIPYTFAVDLDISIGAGATTVQPGEFKSVTTNVSAGKLTMGDTVCLTADVNVSAGALAIDGLTCNSIDCDVSAGSATLSKVNCDKINIDVSAGSATFNMLGNEADYTIFVDKSAGNCNVTNRQGTDANKKIDIDVSAGSVNVHFN